MKKAMDATALNELLVHRETVFRICLGFSSNYDEAEDLAQEVFVKAAGAADSLRDPDRIREWLLRIARNTCIDHGKQRRTRAALLFRFASEKPVMAADPLAPVEDGRVEFLKEAIACLPDRLRDVFVLREYADLSYAEIGRSLHLKEGTVMSRLNRARAFVARVVKENTHAG
jgi:RNA polymerase sigma-70 factor (ECF subfamily)